MELCKLILIGGGGHCKSCIEVIESTGMYEIVGILDVKEKVGHSVLGYTIIDVDDAIVKYVNNEVAFLITIGQIKNAALRVKLYNKLKENGARLATVISENAVVSRRCSVGEGSIIMHGAKLNADVSIGVNCIINTNANIEHECMVGNHVHISTNTVLNGNCVVGDMTFIGSGTTVVQSMEIGKDVVIGAGAVVNKFCEDKSTYIGNPIRKLQK